MQVLISIRYSEKCWLPRVYAIICQAWAGEGQPALPQALHRYCFYAEYVTAGFLWDAPRCVACFRSRFIYVSSYKYASKWPTLDVAEIIWRIWSFLTALKKVGKPVSCFMNRRWHMIEPILYWFECISHLTSNGCRRVDLASCQQDLILSKQKKNTPRNLAIFLLLVARVFFANHGTWDTREGDEQGRILHLQPSHTSHIILLYMYRLSVYCGAIFSCFL